MSIKTYKVITDANLKIFTNFEHNMLRDLITRTNYIVISELLEFDIRNKQAYNDICPQLLCVHGAEHGHCDQCYKLSGEQRDKKNRGWEKRK